MSPSSATSPSRPEKPGLPSSWPFGKRLTGPFSRHFRALKASLAGPVNAKVLGRLGLVVHRVHVAKLAHRVAASSRKTRSLSRDSEACVFPRAKMALGIRLELHQNNATPLAPIDRMNLRKPLFADLSNATGIKTRDRPQVLLASIDADIQGILTVREVLDRGILALK